MKTELYLLNYSFEYQEGITIEELEKKIESLSDDYDFIKKHKDKVLRHDSIYDEVIYPNLKVYDIYDTRNTILNRDINGPDTL